MQDEIDKLTEYTDSHLMVINKQKTKAMLCNSRQKWDFIPELNIKGEHIEILDENKVVGFILRNDLKTSANTSYIINKSYKRVWLLIKAEGFRGKYCPTSRHIREAGSVSFMAGSASLVLPSHSS